ncbi:hypothetical protein ScPMuIL_014430 [Solemya velum]
MSVHKFSEDDWNLQTISDTDGQTNRQAELSKFDRKLTSGWEKAMSQGHFKFKLEKGKLQTKIIPGKKKYVVQLNVPRFQEKRKMDVIRSLKHPFQAEKFNFTKIKPEEILFELVKETNSNGEQQTNGCYDNTAVEHQKKDLIIINVSPMEYGHILIVPDVYSLAPQVLTVKSLELALETILLSSHRGFHVGFNSLCAFASVNHLHLHAYYLEHELFVETCPVQHLCGDLYELDEMPVKGFAFQLHGSTVQKLARTLHKVTSCLHDQEIAHNLHLSRGTVFGTDKTETIRIFLWPRKKVIGENDLAAFNAAFVELAGHLPIKVADLFDGLTEESINETIRSAALEDGEYGALKATVMELCRTCH